jgi:hypothetical protein
MNGRGSRRYGTPPLGFEDNENTRLTERGLSGGESDPL